MIEDLKVKTGAESKAEHLVINWCLQFYGNDFNLSLLTRNVTKALSILMVDYSCAFKFLQCRSLFYSSDL